MIANYDRCFSLSCLGRRRILNLFEPSVVQNIRETGPICRHFVKHGADEAFKRRAQLYVHDLIRVGPTDRLVYDLVDSGKWQSATCHDVKEDTKTPDVRGNTSVCTLAQNHLWRQVQMAELVDQTGSGRHY